MKKFSRKILVTASVIFSCLSLNSAFADEVKADSKPQTKNDVKEVLIFKTEKDKKNFSKEEKEVFKIVKKEVDEDMDKFGVDLRLASHNLDKKGKKEVFVCYSSALYCGKIGVCLTLYRYQNNNWQSTDHFIAPCEISVLSSSKNDLHDILISRQFKLPEAENWDWKWKSYIFQWDGKNYINTFSTNSK